ncbi:hypothetical protein H5410_056720 [Solanum commersonii]|uniref:Uncharacterized protein n=1 Tax=Solanum commersonii TaxID=4109 RepID=A0A9J5WM44_SOLCO|nr:hypothetical protein H5410_056720 [Solanum commersonii]
MSIKKLFPFTIGPDVRGRTHTGCIVNGVRFHVQRCDELRKSQNCGIVVAGYHENEVQTEHEVEIDHNEDESDQEDDTVIEYISDHEENEGNTSTNDDEVDSTCDEDDIGL